jgi:hypothetical protein
MTRINLNASRNIAGPRDIAWGKAVRNIHNNLRGNVNALVFAAVLIVCSLAIGCSKDKPKSVSASSEIPLPQPQTQVAPAPVVQTDSKPARRKVVHRKPATVNYNDKTYGVSFEYPRRYAIETGNAAADLVASSPVPMNFVQPGGTALAAVELPETSFANTDFSSAYFNVSVDKDLSADQCNEFAVPQPKVEAPVSAASSTETPIGSPNSPVPTQPVTSSADPQAASGAGAVANASGLKPDGQTDVSAPAQAEPQGSKLMVGDLELRATEAVSGEGTRQSDAKYFHVYQNGACYEFALNVTTVASENGLMKHVDRDRVFARLEKILDTVKINPIIAPGVTAQTPAATPAPSTAQ